MKRNMSKTLKITTVGLLTVVIAGSAILPSHLSALAGNKEKNKITKEIAATTTVDGQDIDLSNWKANTIDEIKEEIERQLESGDVESAEYDEDTMDYVIRWGDTIWGISNAFGLDQDQLVKVNKIKNPDLIYAGDIITLDVLNNLLNVAQKSYKNTVSKSLSMGNLKGDKGAPSRPSAWTPANPQPNRPSPTKPSPTKPQPNKPAPTVDDKYTGTTDIETGDKVEKPEDVIMESVKIESIGVADTDNLLVKFSDSKGVTDKMLIGSTIRVKASNRVRAMFMMVNSDIDTILATYVNGSLNNGQAKYRVPVGTVLNAETNYEPVSEEVKLYDEDSIEPEDNIVIPDDNPEEEEDIDAPDDAIEEDKEDEKEDGDIVVPEDKGGEEGTTDPVEREEGTTDPVKGEGGTTDPVEGEGEVTDPEEGEVTDPEEGEVTDPEEGEVTDPEEGEITDPEEGEVTDPEEGEVTDPEEGEVTDPEEGEVTDPEEGEITDPEEGEITDPEEGEVTDPEEGEVTDPEEGEVTDPEVTNPEITDPEEGTTPEEGGETIGETIP